MYSKIQRGFKKFNWFYYYHINLLNTYVPWKDADEKLKENIPLVTYYV